jgi:pimeloyl-ACP methyl ester carboxylesterase
MRVGMPTLTNPAGIRPLSAQGRSMELRDDDLVRFAADRAAPLPVPDAEGYAESEGARIWYASFGSGTPVVLLHGGLGCAGNFGYQVPALMAHGYRAIAIDSRGHGRSTRGAGALHYALMADDVLAVLDRLGVPDAAFAGWSDGAIVALTIAMRRPERVQRVFAFGVNMDLSGVADVAPSDPLLARIIASARRDYERLSPAPEEFGAFSNAVFAMMATEPDYSADELRAIRVPVAIVRGENDALIKAEHAEYLARTIPGAQLVPLPEVGHFALLQRPAEFNEALLAFLAAS